MDFGWIVKRPRRYRSAWAVVFAASLYTSVGRYRFPNRPIGRAQHGWGAKLVVRLGNLMLYNGERRIRKYPQCLSPNATSAVVNARSWTRSWKIGSGSVREITERFSTKLAYTTVMTFVVRLHRKGMLQRQWKEKGYIYSAKISAREMADQRAAVFIRCFFSDSTQHPDVLLSSFVEAMHQYNPELLNQLEANVSVARRASAAIEEALPEPKEGLDFPNELQRMP
jgi:predicted transcriptional regulator